MDNIDGIVGNGSCIGCCACVSMCPVAPLNMRNGPLGFPVPMASEGCTACKKCLTVCIQSEIYAEDD